MIREHYDVAIIGAGPAGCAAALGLRDKGLKVVMVDKALFPREKICGDAIPGPAIKALSLAMPFFDHEFTTLEGRQRIIRSTVNLDHDGVIDREWKLPAWNIRRQVFDGFLHGLAKKYSGADILEGWTVSGIRAGIPHLVLSDKRKESFSARMLIVCDGAGSVTAGSMQHPSTTKQEQVIACRGYYRDLRLDGTTNHFYVSRQFLPGYFWVFPMHDNIFNAGFGLLAGHDGKAPLNVKEALVAFIRSPERKNIFAHAGQVSEIKGGILPLGGQRRRYSGDGYLLAGDAASLADPLMGNGVDKAVISGLLAADHAAMCFRHNDFSSAFNAAYDELIKKEFSSGLRNNRTKRRIITAFPALLTLYAFLR